MFSSSQSSSFLVGWLYIVSDLVNTWALRVVRVFFVGVLGFKVAL